MSKRRSSNFVTFNHLPFPVSCKSAGITAAIAITGDSEEACVAFSFCSPKEKSFLKKTGRSIATSRLEKRGITVHLGEKESPRAAVLRGLEGAVMCEASWLPTWFLRLLEEHTAIEEVVARSISEKHEDRARQRELFEKRQRVVHA